MENGTMVHNLQLLTKTWHDPVHDKHYAASRIYQDGRLIKLLDYLEGNGDNHYLLAKQWADVNYLAKSEFNLVETFHSKTKTEVMRWSK